MAKVIGTSQAWKQISEILESRNLTVDKAEDIHKLLTQKKKTYEKAKEDATKVNEQQLDQAVKNLADTKADFQAAIQVSKRESDYQIELIETTIQLLQEEGGFLWKIINQPKIRNYRTRIAGIKKHQNKYVLNLQANIAEKQKNIDFKKINRELLIEKQCENIKRDVTCLEQTLLSPFFAGAIAELELIELLRKLPEHFYLMNDLELNLGRGVPFDGEWLQSAQIDHLVISPAGIFVIETKNWSKEFLEHGDYFNPYQQVKRSSYLCYKILENRHPNIKVRNIIAYKGHIPPKPDESFAKVLPLKEVGGYIMWFKENILGNEQIQCLAEYLKEYPAQGAFNEF